MLSQIKILIQFGPGFHRFDVGGPVPTVHSYWYGFLAILELNVSNMIFETLYSKICISREPLNLYLRRFSGNSQMPFGPDTFSAALGNWVTRMADHWKEA